MADKEKDKGRSKRSKRTRTATTKKNKPPAKEDFALRRLDAVERVPSNAPTMAIAPSDYEHIYHEGPNQAGATTKAAVTSPPSTPPTQINATGNNFALPQQAQQYTRTNEITRSPTEEQVGGGGGAPAQPNPRPQFGVDLQVTPDGYTLLGHVPDPGRRTALPPHIVRSSNQFSRPALARLSRYLASRAEMPSK